jgi:hypothetical protein
MGGPSISRCLYQIHIHGQLSPDRRYHASPAALGESHSSPLMDIYRTFQITCLHTEKLTCSKPQSQGLPDPHTANPPSPVISPIGEGFEGDDTLSQRHSIIRREATTLGVFLRHSPLDRSSCRFFRL